MFRIAYVVAVVLANLAITHFGPSAAPVVAFALIGATLTLRDRIHDRYPRWLALLIPLGAAISALLGAGQVAVASAVAFLLSEGADSLVYHRLRHLPWLARTNGSNLVGAGVDSLVFPVLAFGGFPLWVIVGQFAAKSVGGALWAQLLRRPRLAPAALALLLAAVPVRAQSIAVDAGLLVTSEVRKPVAELSVSGPAIGPVTPFGILSQPAQGGRPTGIIQVGVPAIHAGRFFSTVSAGASLFPWQDYRPVAVVGAFAGFALPGRFYLFALGNQQLRHRDWSVVAGLAFTIAGR